jgi:hypothetical protein
VFRHAVMFRWADGVDTDAASAALGAGLAELPAIIPEIKGYSFGPDAGVSEGNFDYAVVGEFDSADDYVRYRDHPAHLALIERYVAGRISDRAAVQFGEG